MIWTYVLRGGREFLIQMKGNPVMKHDGNLSIWSVYLPSDTDKEALNTFLEDWKVSYTEYADLDRTSGGLREKMLEVSGPDFVFRTPECPGCFWFDPLTETQCGYENWPPESRENPSEKALDDLSKCPER